MSKKVLIRKQAGGVQQFQQIGGGSGPSFMGLARRLKDPTASGWQKVLALGGMAGKTAAGIGAANQTLQQMHGGNAFAPLNLAYTYQGLDPTTGMERDATLGEQQDAIARRDIRNRSNQTLTNLHEQGYNVRGLASGAQTYIPPPAGLPAQTPDSPSRPTYSAAQLRGPPGSAQRRWRDRGNRGIAPPGYGSRAPQPVAAQPPASTFGPSPPPVPPTPAPGFEVNASGTGTDPNPVSLPTPVAQPPVAQPPVAQPVAQPPVAQPVAQPPVAQPVAQPPVAQAAEEPVTGLPQELIAATANVSLENDNTTFVPQPSSWAEPPALGTGASPPPVPALGTGASPPPVPPVPAQGDLNTPRVTDLPPNARTPVSGQTTDDGYKIVGAKQTGVPDPFQGVSWGKSFATYVLDQFGDMLHKADPHVAGLLAFRVYMDKVMR